MKELELIVTCVFYLSLVLAFFTYGGYCIFTLPFRKKRLVSTPEVWPSVTLVVAAYNEEDFILEKISNSLALAYDKKLLQFIFVTDGSTDNTPTLIAQFPQIKLLHQSGRAGKTAALNRAMVEVNTQITVFSDANTILNPQALKLLVQHYQDPKVGGVSGEKVVLSSDKDAASGAGEGLYWKYETLLKKNDSDFYSLVGAPGELISFRTALYQELENDTILDDFMLSMRICQQGYVMVYEPAAQACETASANIKEELKRKIRICAGGFQSIARLSISPWANFKLFYLYFSHRIMRWAVAPYCLLLALISNAFLLQKGAFYQAVAMAQLLFYLQAFLGYLFKDVKVKLKGFFVPYYFLVMNYAAIAGLFKYLNGKQSAAWERSKRAVI